MLSPKEIKARIKGVKNIQQITRTMQMVAVAKLKKTQTKAVASRPYEYKLQELLNIVRQAKKFSYGEESAGGKLKEVKKIGILLISSDQGLCGSYNTNNFHHILNFIKANPGKEFILNVIGKKGYNFFKRRNFTIKEFYPQNHFKDLSFVQITEVIDKLSIDYKNGVYGELHLFFTRFESIMRSNPIRIKLFPFEVDKKPEGSTQRDFLFEPDPEEILNQLLPKYLNIQVYKALIESIASEQAARMVSMKSATDNAEEMLGGLILNYNKSRQASITKELLEVASGAEALKK